MNKPPSHRYAAYLAATAMLFIVINASAQDSAAPKGSIQEAQELMNRSNELFKSGQYTEAIQVTERVLTIRENALGREHPDTAQALNDLARLYYFTGTYAKAEPLFQRALAIREKVFGPEHLDTAESLRVLGVLYYEMGAYAKAAPLYQRALAIREKVLGPEHPDTAQLLNNLANLYRVTGLYSKAEPLFQRALAIREKALGPAHPQVANLLGNLAVLYFDTGSYAKAESLYRRALAIREKVLGPEHLDTASMLNNLAILYLATGAHTQAEPLYQRVLAIREKALGPEHPEVAAALSNLAGMYVQIGMYEKAEPLLQRAVAINDKALGLEHPNTADFLDNIALMYRNTGKYTEAEPLDLRALAIREKALGPEHPLVAQSLNRLGSLYGAMGDQARAVQLHERALAIYEKALGPEHPSVAETINALGRLNWAKGEITQALQRFKRAQVIQATNSGRFLLSGSEARKRAYLQSLTENTYSDISFSVAVASRESIRLGFTGVLQYKGRLLDAVVDNVTRLRKNARPQDVKLFEQLAEIANQLSILTFQGPGELSVTAYRQRLEQLFNQREQVEAELSKHSAEFRQQIAPVTLAAVTAAIPKDAVLVEWFRYTPIDPKQIAEETKQNTPRYVAYVLKHGRDPIVIDIGEAGPIESLVRDLREAIVAAQRGDFRSKAAALSDKLLKPLRSHLQGYERILMSPDGALNLLPMSVLLDEHGDYLAQHYEITYLTSARDLLRFTPKLKAQGEAVVMADPDFGSSTIRVAQIESDAPPLRSADLDRSGLVFRPLPNSALEARELKNMVGLKDSRVLLQSDASESNLKQVHGPRILHVATHGFFLSNQELDAEIRKKSGTDFSAPVGENPLLRSGIALAGANTRHAGVNDDGILTALEAAQLDLYGTELVVLSACDTGVGDVQNGEGVYGLRRALVLAGAQTQVTSLWKVSDDATRALMVDYYQRLLKGEGRSAALHHAQLDMLARPELSHPYYWASFVTVGNWTSLPVR